MSPASEGISRITDKMNLLLQSEKNDENMFLNNNNTIINF